MGIQFGMHEMPLIGGFFENPHETQKLQAMHQAAQAYQAMRPELQQAQLNALRQQMLMAAPMQRALAQMYGPGATFNLSEALQNPVSDRMSNIGAPTTAGGKTPRSYGPSAGLGQQPDTGPAPATKPVPTAKKVRKV